MDLKKLETILANYPKFRLKQAKQAIFENFVESWEEVTVFPKDLRAKLEKEFPLGINAKMSGSMDGTVKALVTFPDGKFVETVLMRHQRKFRNGQVGGGRGRFGQDTSGGQDDQIEYERNSVCVSSQAGCPMACAFCATGDMGFFRNLTADEIVIQVLLFERLLKKGEPVERARSERVSWAPRSGLIKQRVNNVVFMGMGEPLYNYVEVMKAVEILNKDLGIAARHISISTCGIVEGIKKLMNEPYQVNLAISLHAPNDEMRDKIMPVNKSQNIEKLMRAVKDYLVETNRKVMIEYLLIGNVNDSVKTAKELAGLLKKYLGNLFVVNVISYNPTGKFTPPSRNCVRRFKEVLEGEGVKVTQRFTFGRDVEGACGQLAVKGVKGVLSGRAFN